MVEIYAAKLHDLNSTGVLERTWHSSYRPLSVRVRPAKGVERTWYEDKGDR